MKMLLSQAALKTKIRALKKNFLTEEDFKKIDDMNSENELVAFLSSRESFNTVFNIDTEELVREKMEQRLMLLIYKDLEKIYYFSSFRCRKFLKIYFEKYEINAIKNMLHKHLGLNNNDMQKNILEDEINFFEKYSSVDLRKLYNATSPKSFIEMLKGTVYYNVLSPLINKEIFSPFECDMLLDNYRYINMLKIAKKSLRKKSFLNFKKSYNTLIDITNIYYIYRAKKYYELSNVDLYTITLPTNTSLSKNLIESLIGTSTDEEFYYVLEKSPYKKFFMDFNFKKISSRINKILENNVYKIYKSTNSYEAIVIKYMHEKETEKDEIIRTIEKIKYKKIMKGGF